MILDILFKIKVYQLFTNSAIMPYLLKKNCTKYYFENKFDEENQKNFIKELKDVKFILSDKINDYHPFSPNKNYQLLKAISKLIILNINHMNYLIY